MSLIFIASTDLGSTRQTSRFIGPFLRWISPNVSPETIHNTQVFVRKCGHLTGYAILAILTLRALQRESWLRVWSPSAAKWAEIISALYAVSDEWHQSFVPTRMGSLWDVLLDSIGAAIGLALVWRLGRLRKQW